MREHDAVTVDDDAAVGHHRHDGDAVCFRHGVQLAVLDHLQVEEAAGEQQEHEQNDARRDRQPHPEMVELELCVAQLDAGIY